LGRLSYRIGAKGAAKEPHVSTLVYYAFLALTICVASAGPAHAYLDPGTGSIILQSLIGAVAAGLVIGRHYLYRLKAWLGLTTDAARKSGQKPSE
jgi:hypothetical protein